MLAVLGVFGAVMGSFLGVVAHRVPRRASIVRPPSACPSCGERIRPWDNIPLLSWCLLGGRCRGCRARISFRYPLVELATALAFVFVGWWALAGGLQHPGLGGAGTAFAAGVIVFAAFLFFACVGIVLTLIDVDTLTLPDRIVLPALVVALVLLAASAALAAEWVPLARAALGCVAAGGFFALIVLVVPRGMGLGDAKLALLVGLYLGWVGWGALAVGVFAGFLLGALWGVALLVTRRVARGSAIPFGPWMLAGSWLGIVAGPALTSGYLSAMGLT